jgi:hypothetical protein
MLLPESGRSCSCSRRHHVPDIGCAGSGIHDGRLVKLGTMAELRTGSVTLEDVFVRVVGGHPAEKLDWL